LYVEYGVYVPIFAMLFYLDNRYRISSNNRSEDSTQIKNGIRKLFAAFSISELIYSAYKISSQYYLLQRDIEYYHGFYVGGNTGLVSISCIIDIKHKGCEFV
jgi:hypothetical protein